MGALLQEGIDVLAIGIALRAVVPGTVHTVAMPPEDVALARRLRADHDAVLPAVERIRTVADALSSEAPDLAPAQDLLESLETVLVPHEREEELLLVPLVSRTLGGTESTAALSRTHAEIEHQVGRLRRLLGDIDAEGAPSRGRRRAAQAALRAVRRAPPPQRAGGGGRLRPRPRPDGAGCA